MIFRGIFIQIFTLVSFVWHHYMQFKQLTHLTQLTILTRKLSYDGAAKDVLANHCFFLRSDTSQVCSSGSNWIFLEDI